MRLEDEIAELKAKLKAQEQAAVPPFSVVRLGDLRKVLDAQLLARRGPLVPPLTPEQAAAREAEEERQRLLEAQKRQREQEAFRQAQHRKLMDEIYEKKVAPYRGRPQSLWLEPEVI